VNQRATPFLSPAASLLRRLSRRAKRRAPRVLLAWEIGAGFTHTRNALGVVSHLAANGVSCIFATADPRFDPWFRAHGASLTQTYLWPPMRVGAAVPECREARTLTDLLANYGLGDPANLAAAIAHYDTLFDLVRPDALLCENAFGAALAARKRIPTVLFGSTLLFMPPRDGDGFAPIDPSAPEPSWPTQDLLDSVNAALGASARPLLSCAAELMDCAAMLPFGPAAFDPYAHARTEAVLAPYCPDLPRSAPAGTRRETVIYLHESAQYLDELVDAVARLPGPKRLYIPALTQKRRSTLERAGVIVEERMMSLDAIASKARILVHHGGVTLTAVALALGIPQVTLARFHDNGVAGRFVAARGLGASMSVDSVDAERLRNAVLACGAEDVARRAAEAAPEFRRWFDSDPTFSVAQATARLLGMDVLHASAAPIPPTFTPL